MACRAEGRECFVPLTRGLAAGCEVCLLERRVDISPCGGLSEPSGPSPSACAVSAASTTVVMTGECDVVVMVMMVEGKREMGAGVGCDGC